MKKAIKILGLGGALAIILILGVTMVMAQELDDPTTPEALPETTEEDNNSLQPDYQGHRHYRGIARGVDSILEILGETLGMSSDEILAELHQGISIADLAESQGVEIETIIGLLMEQARERITEQVNTPWIPRASFHGGNLVGILAETLDMTSEEVISELSTGISVADLAAGHGVDVQEIVDAYVADQRERLDQAVEAGRLTQEQADEMLALMTERVSEQIHEPWGSGECQPGLMPGMQGHHRGGGSIPDSAEGQPSGFRGHVMQGTNL